MNKKNGPDGYGIGNLFISILKLRLGRAILAWIAFYLIITIVHGFIENEKIKFIFAAVDLITQCLLDLLIVYLAARIQSAFNSRLTYRIFSIGFLLAALTDFIYGIYVNILGISEAHGTLLELSYYLPFNTCMSLMAVTCYRLINKKDIAIKRRAIIIASAFFVLLSYTYFSSVNMHTWFTQSNLILVWLLLTQSGIIVGASILLFFGSNLTTQLLGSGLLNACAATLLIHYFAFFGNLQAGIPLDFFWTLGLATIVIALLLALFSPKSNDIKFEIKSSGTRAKFLVGLIGFLFFVLAIREMFFYIYAVFKTNDIWVATYLFIVFLSTTLLPLAFLFRALSVVPMIRMLRSIKNPKNVESKILSIDPEILELGRDLLGQLSEIERARISQEIAAQVSHDIRSPLAALSIAVTGLEGFPEEKKRLIIDATTRIRVIANDLLNHSKSKEINRLKFYDLETYLLQIIEEKRLEWKSKSDSVILFKRSNIEFAVSDMEIETLGRIVSNLINNSLESISVPNGEVEVAVVYAEDSYEIIVKDNGSGIPNEILKKLKEGPISYGKIGESGNGIGLHSARQHMSAMNGALEINSIAGKGTTIRLCSSAKKPRIYNNNS